MQVGEVALPARHQIVIELALHASSVEDAGLHRVHQLIDDMLAGKQLLPALVPAGQAPASAAWLPALTLHLLLPCTKRVVAD